MQQILFIHLFLTPSTECCETVDNDLLDWKYIVEFIETVTQEFSSSVTVVTHDLFFCLIVQDTGSVPRDF